MSNKFKHKVIWITGASSGIGEALAKCFSKRGAKLVLSARNVEQLKRVRDDCLAAGSRDQDVLVLPLDITREESIPTAHEAVISQFGCVDMLINNAGVSQRSFFEDTDLEVYRSLFEVNVFGQIALTKAVLANMIERQSGHLVITSSLAGKFGAPQRTGYCAAKHAVMGFFDALRTEVAVHAIKVTSVTPGFIRTNVSRNALTAHGEAAGFDDEDVSGGMEVEECVVVIMRGFDDGLEEIAVGTGDEMAILELKRTDPTQAFRVLEGLANQIRGAS